MIAFSQLLEAGVAGLVDAITSLENELRETKQAVAGLTERVHYLENAQNHHKSVLEDLTMAGIPKSFEADIETLIDDRIDSALDMRLDDAIESALSGREIEVTLSGSATL